VRTSKGTIQLSDILVSGLTIIRNGVRLNYPFMEAIRSALAICDEYVVVAGDSDDGTLDRLASLDDPRIRIINTRWSPYTKPQKCLLAQQTNIGLGFCSGRWCLYMQANEVLHEDDLPQLRALMETHVDNPAVEAMLVERLTLWCDYGHYVPVYPRRYKYTARIVRPNIGTYSIRDGMSFAIFDGFSTHGRYPNAIDTGVDLYRYGYVHSVTQQALKFEHAVHKTEASDTANPDFYTQFYPRQFIAPYSGPHPAVMNDRIAAYPAEDRLRLDECRTALTPGERKRLVESYLYSRSGLPRLSRNRFHLVGELQPKPRPRLGLLNGTLALD
jgi:hypothetical protein